MKILLTGASGYVGNKLAHILTDRGHTVHALIRSDSAMSVLRMHGIQFFKGDILDKESIARAMRGCTKVYHTAALAKLWDRNPLLFYEYNVGGTRNILDVAKQCGVQKLVYTSTCGVWGPAKNHLFTELDPRISSFDNDYDLSKHLAEQLVREYSYQGLFSVIVNPPRIFVPGFLVKSGGVNRFVNQLLQKRLHLLPWDLEAKANYSYIDDVVRGHILAMERGLGGERYILGGENVSYRRFIESFRHLTGMHKITLRVPTFLARAWSEIEMVRTKLSHHEPLLTPKTVARFCLDKTFDCTKAIKQLGYSITPFELGLKNTIEHLKTNHL